MKTYTHPTINLPAGAVVAKFYDHSDTGDETLPKCIIDIGDVEEGFQFDIGNYIAPSCQFKLRNDPSVNTIYSLLTSKDLWVSVVVDNIDLYFYGIVWRPSIDPREDFKNTISFNAFHALSFLQYYNIEDFKTDILALGSDPSGYQKMNTYFRLIAQHCKLKSFVSSDIEYGVSRKYSWFDDPDWIEYYLNDVLLDNSYWGSAYENRYDNQFENAFDMLNKLKNDFFFFPSIKFDGTDYKLKILEKDQNPGYVTITLPDIKGEKEDYNLITKSINVDLQNRPDTMSSTDILYSIINSTMYGGEEADLQQIHTNISRGPTDGFLTNMLIYVRHHPTASPGTAMLLERISNYEKTGYVNYTSFHNAVFYAYKSLYYDFVISKTIKLRGLKATLSGSTKMEYLAPGYRFTINSDNYYISSVKKSLTNNSSEIKVFKYYKELVENGNCEAALPTILGSSISTYNGSVALSTTTSKSGSKSVKFTCDGITNGYHYYGKTRTALQVGKTYRISCWVYIPTSNTEITYLRLYMYGGVSVQDQTSVQGEWVKLSITSTIQSGDVRDFILANLVSQITSESFSVDEISILEIEG